MQHNTDNQKATVRQKAPTVLTRAKHALNGDSNDAEHDALFALIEAYGRQINHADKLAEALRELTSALASDLTNWPRIGLRLSLNAEPAKPAWDKAQAALAAYESEAAQ